MSVGRTTLYYSLVFGLALLVAIARTTSCAAETVEMRVFESSAKFRFNKIVSSLTCDSCEIEVCTGSAGLLRQLLIIHAERIEIFKLSGNSQLVESKPIVVGSNSKNLHHMSCLDIDTDGEDEVVFQRQGESALYALQISEPHHTTGVEPTKLLGVEVHEWASIRNSPGQLASFDPRARELRLGTIAKKGEWAWQEQLADYAKLLHAVSRDMMSAPVVFLLHETNGQILALDFNASPPLRYMTPLEPLAPGSEADVRFGDFNGDGFVDVLKKRSKVLGFSAAAGGEWGMVPTEVYGLDGADTILAVGDMNGDGHDDIIAANPSGAVSLYQSAASELFPPLTIDAGPAISEIELAEFLPDTDSQFFYRAKILSRFKHHTAIIKAYPRGMFRGQAIASGGRLSDRLPGPFACDGFNPYSIKPFGRTRRCPAYYAAMAIDDGGGLGAGGERVNHELSCCRLPRMDILDYSKKEIVIDRACPDNTIAVGLHPESYSETEQLVCQPIREDKYALSSAVSGVYWGLGSSQESGDGQIALRAITPAISLAIQRVRRNATDVDGCIAPVPGAVLTARQSSAACSDSRYSQLLEKGGQTQKVLEVLYPCAAEPDPFDPASGCD